MSKPNIRTGTEIALNSAKCLKCNDVLVSKHRHDFVTCSCGNGTAIGTEHVVLV